jgi:hypothetical protein
MSYFKFVLCLSFYSEHLSTAHKLSFHSHVKTHLLAYFTIRTAQICLSARTALEETMCCEVIHTALIEQWTLVIMQAQLAVLFCYYWLQHNAYTSPYHMKHTACTCIVSWWCCRAWHTSIGSYNLWVPSNGIFRKSPCHGL